MTADLIVIVHFAFLLFASFGALLAMRWRWIPWVHVPAVVWGTFVEVTGRICPLTPLENRFRAAAGRAPYHGDFVEHYIMPVLYPSALTRERQWLLALLLVLFNLVVYTLVIRRRRR